MSFHVLGSTQYISDFIYLNFRIVFFLCRMGLELVRALGDRPAEGRALGSLANAYYLLSNFTEAIECYREVCISYDHYFYFL